MHSNIDRASFRQLFAIASHLADHVFNVFDHYKRDAINFNNFLLALCIFTNAPSGAKMDLIRDIFGDGGNRVIYRPELIHILDLIIDNACNLMGVNIHNAAYISIADIKANQMADLLLQGCGFGDWISFADLDVALDRACTFKELHDFVLRIAGAVCCLPVPGTKRSPPIKPLGLYDSLLCHLFPECRRDSSPSLTVPESEDGSQFIQGYVYKQTWFLNRLKRRWLVLRNNMLYSFHKETSTKPNIVIALCGASCEPVTEALSPLSVRQLGNARHAFKLASPLSNCTRIIYLQSAEQRDRWVRAVRIAAADFKLSDHYQMSSIVHPCLPNVFPCRGALTSRRYMLKYIDKHMVNDCDLEAMRIEAGVLRFAEHADIAQSVAVYEDGAKIHILRHYIPHWVRLDEIIRAGGTMSVNSVALIMRQVLTGLNFLQQHGLVLGAFGPANIVLKLDELRQHRIQLVDIGLRKFFMSALDELTRSFVAPEVDTRTQLGPKADMWSVGAMIYRLLTPDSCADDLNSAKYGLPDLSRTRGGAEIHKTLKRLLSKNPSRRYCATDTLRLPWIRDAEMKPFQVSLPGLAYARSLQRKLVAGQVVVLDPALLPSTTETPEPSTLDSGNAGGDVRC